MYPSWFIDKPYELFRKIMNRNMGTGKSPFVVPAAVEAWDTWFRWRENGDLRDDTVEATWQRVASALACVELRDAKPDFERRLFEVFADWRLLLDERIFASAGTGTMSWPQDGLVAVLNVVGFVRPSATQRVSIDFAAMRDCAELATHALDNATVLRDGSGPTAKRLRIGIIGLADALILLGTEYGSADAQAMARKIAQTLAEGCLIATIALARTRGNALRCDPSWLRCAHRRNMPRPLIARALEHGVRHAGLTSITPQPRLARFANDVADATHPLAADRAFATGLSGHAWPKIHAAASVPAQLDMRGALQPWMDEPISCPVRSNGKPAPASHLDWYAHAAALRLGALSWQADPTARISLT